LFQKKLNKPWHVEGSDNAEWVLMDYAYSSSRVSKQIREYYNIELGEMQKYHNSKQILKQNGKRK
jgi:ribosomal silencing factor RsfS